MSLEEVLREQQQLLNYKREFLENYNTKKSLSVEEVQKLVGLTKVFSKKLVQYTKLKGSCEEVGENLKIVRDVNSLIGQKLASEINKLDNRISNIKECVSKESWSLFRTYKLKKFGVEVEKVWELYKILNLPSAGLKNLKKKIKEKISLPLEAKRVEAEVYIIKEEVKYYRCQINKVFNQKNVSLDEVGTLNLVYEKLQNHSKKCKKIPPKVLQNQKIRISAKNVNTSIKDLQKTIKNKTCKEVEKLDSEVERCANKLERTIIARQSMKVEQKLKRNLEKLEVWKNVRY